MKLLILLMLIGFSGCGDDSSSKAATTADTPTQEVFKIADGYYLISADTSMQIEGILDKELGLVHYNQTVHNGSFACVVDFTVTNIDSANNLYHLRIQDTSFSISNPSPCHGIYGIYWLTLTSDSTASLKRI